MIHKQQTTIDRVFVLSIVVPLFLHFIHRGEQGFITWSVFLGLLFIFHLRAWLFIRKTDKQQKLFVISSATLILYTLIRSSYPYPLHIENALSIILKYTHINSSYRPTNSSIIFIMLWVTTIITDLISVFLIKRKS